MKIGEKNRVEMALRSFNQMKIEAREQAWNGRSCRKKVEARCVTI